MKRLCTLFVICLTLSCWLSVADAQTVRMPDANLAAAVRNALDLGPNARITKQAMQRLTVLIAGNSEISDLTGLEHATQLTGLHLYDNQIRNVSPLAELTKLKELSLSGNQISNIRPLSGLTQLELLHLSGNKINNAGVRLLTPLKQLRELALAWNQIGNITPLAKLTKLERLTLNRNKIRDVSPLAKLVNLQALYLAENPIQDFSPLASLTKLIGLDFPLPETEPIVDEAPGHEAFTSAGPKIEGPWLWMIAAMGQDSTDAAALGRDHLAAATNGAVTEKRIAKNGVKAGALVGNRAWTPGKLAPTGGNNIGETLNAIGLGSGNIEFYVAYGSIALNSPGKQKTRMYVGSDDNHKVWLNGQLVHEQLGWNWAHDYQESFPVTLKQGKNVLLFAIQNGGGPGGGYLGFESDTAYSLMPPSVLPNKGVIPDRSLAARVRSRLGLGPNVNLTKQKMRKLTQLTANDAGIKDLTGLEHATQLRSLSLVGNQIRDVNPLAELKNLQVLSLSKNRLEGTGVLFALQKKNPNLELDITIPMEEHPPIYWLTGSLTDQNENITRPAYIQGLTGVSADVETLWESSSPIRPNTRQIAVDTVAGKLYWTEQINKSRSELKRVNLDGSVPQKLATLRTVLTSIAVDPKKRKLYWTNADGRIQSANLNGKQIKTLVKHLDAPANLTLDADGGKLYWVEGLRIWRSDLNGKNIKRVVTAASDTGEVLAVSSIAAAAGKIYWTQVEQDATKYPNSTFHEKFGERILRADLNGSNIEELIVSENLLESDLAVDPTGESLYYTAGFNPFGVSHIFRRDLNGTAEDEIAVYYEGIGGPNQIVLGISPASVAAAPAESAQTSAQIEIPDTTLLLANYPNPFNPETWIPYQLAVPAAVQITIYDTRGVLVRRLELGHQAAGNYTRRSRAAYWDGRNSQGERVASGVYFYQFQAGNVSSLRKMLILK